jgi:aromatic ring-opening dioxygenase catalytic subunit (LigB family)
MGAIVAAVFTTHVPRLMIRDPEARRAYMGKNVSTFYDAMAEVERERLRGLAFDGFVLVDTHWFTTLEWVLNEHAYDYAGDPELAVAIAETARGAGLRAVASAHRGLPVHYPTLNVMSYFNPDAARRVLTMGVCQTTSVDNDLAFGAAVGDAIRRSGRRVVLVASGGLSHRFWDYDRIKERASASPEDVSSPENRAWDERVMEWFRAGAHAEVLAAAADYRRQCSPEGRFSHYLIVAGALGGRSWTWRGVQHGRYEAAIGTGQAIFWFAPEGGGQ